MRISSSLMFDRSARTMGALSDTAESLQGQIASGKRLTAPSSDAAAYRQLTGIRRAAADETQDAVNIKRAQALLTASDTALATIEQQLQRASELALQGANGALSAEQKTVIAGQIDAILEDVVRLANAVDPAGAPLFSGGVETQPYTLNPDGTVSYAGDGEAAPIPIGNGATVQATTSGERVFAVAAAGGPSDAFAILKSLSDSLRAGTSMADGLKDIQGALSAVGGARASIGARGARLELETARLGDVSVAREEARSNLEDADITATITELQKTLTVLQATQASFSRLSSLSLFDYLR